MFFPCVTDNRISILLLTMSHFKWPLSNEWNEEVKYLFWWRSRMRTGKTKQTNSWSVVPRDLKNTPQKTGEWKGYGRFVKTQTNGQMSGKCYIVGGKLLKEANKMTWKRKRCGGKKVGLQLKAHKQGTGERGGIAWAGNRAQAGEGEAAGREGKANCKRKRHWKMTEEKK